MVRLLQKQYHVNFHNLKVKLKKLLLVAQVQIQIQSDSFQCLYKYSDQKQSDSFHSNSIRTHYHLTELKVKHLYGINQTSTINLLF